MPAKRTSRPKSRRASGQRLSCIASYLGRVPYREAWDLQQQLAEAVASGEQPPTILLLEHPPTYTFGRRGHAEHLLWSQSELESRGIEVHWVDRGGDVTYHGPGQLVGYPLIPLGKVDADGRLPNPDYIGYLRRLEATLIRGLAHYGLQGEQLEGLTGVWVSPSETQQGPDLAGSDQFSKIAAIGVKVDARGISRHGFALNVNPDMSYWQGIIPCGLEGKPVIRMADLLPDPPPLPEIARVVADEFSDVFGLDIEWQDSIQPPN
ncbi:MAG: lipoyl(octanoyl) transferase LipB [Anaerolineales bacterium]|nr:lipoyl(octanoyl) transferase LipB [Anaerolineales bacterium]